MIVLIAWNEAYPFATKTLFATEFPGGHATTHVLVTDRVRMPLIWKASPIEENGSTMMTQIRFPLPGCAREGLPMCLLHENNFAAATTNQLISGDLFYVKVLHLLVDVAGRDMLGWGHGGSSC